MLVFFSQTKMKKFSWKTEQKKWKRIGNRTLFMLHGDECTFVKGHYIVERMQINMLFCSSTSYLVSSRLFVVVVVVVVVVVIGGEGYSFSARLSRPL